MKIIILRNNFKEALAMAERGIGDNLNLPVLKNFLIKAEDNNVFISSTNLELGITVKTSAKVMKEGSITVSAGILSSLVSNIAAERLDLEEKNGVLEIKSDNYEVSLPLAQVSDFPILPSVEDQNKYFEINSSVIREAFEKVATSVQFSEIRPEISGVLFNFELSECILAGTDIFRLSEKKISQGQFSSNFEEGFKYIIPLKTVQEFLRIFSAKTGKETNIRFYFDENQILIKGEDCEIISRLINGNFPDYIGLKIIPKEFKTEIELGREEFMNALKLAGIVSQSINDVKLKVGDSKKNLEVLSTEKSLGKTKTLLPAKITGEPLEIYFNWKYLFDGLKTFKEKEIILGLNGHDKPALIKSKDTSFLYVLMPIRQ